ncbi:PHP domain-containing protein [Actinoplanes solisilvae]|uniref:PHP domain-containing protein n=1 Tax=Actinoplanes solisilvae TaxID=2486853 RepID=UPI00196A5A9C|nr:PHP domain-containing protein [Actinoplanes solisilvae]
MLPADSHVHSEWSWDAAVGDMEATCARAVEIGLPALAFTEHLDHTAWTATDPPPVLAAYAGADGVIHPPAFDAEGYLAAIERCRDRFPALHVLSGLEVGEPHRHPAQVAAVLATGPFDRVLGSLHCLPVDGGGFCEPAGLFERHEADRVIRDYLAEVPTVVACSDDFEVFAHIDYPIRYLPDDAEPFDPDDYEDEFRLALRAIAEGGRTLEVNTCLPLHPRIVRWWREEGGTTVSFGSDAHLPAVLANGFQEATHMVESHGFRPGRLPYDFWTL